MIMSSFVLSIDQIGLLLNILYDKEETNFTLYSYLLGRDLFEISFDDKSFLKISILKNEYNNIINNFTNLENIIPPYKTIRDILIGSGILKVNNWTEIIKKFEDIKKADPLKGDRLTFIGFDTNCFMNRIYSILLNHFNKDIKKFGFVLSNLIIQELKFFNKISKSMIDRLNEQVKNKAEIFQEFWNQDTLNSRKRHIGRIEFNKIRKNSFTLFDSQIEKDDNEDMDLQIINNLKKQTHNKGYDLLLLSFDRQFYEHSRNPGIISYYLDVPTLDNLELKYEVSWEQLYDLIYLTSIYYGAIRLKASKSFKIFGIWRGKNTTEWDNECVKLEVESEKFSRMIKQQLNILNS